ncbi:MAG: hypothetical protein HYY17_15700 [Planctomycetes bacterium]|nr:hypothetical protein [Planctomycetota bacterium]
MTIFYSPDYVLSAHSFDTTRKASWVAESLRENPIPGVELREPRPLTESQVTETHSPEYVRAVRTDEPRGLAESQGFAWDPGLWPMTAASNGGAVEAALTAMKDGVSGSLSSGLHHARRGEGRGFCTFNGLAIAAREARKAGARTILILDLDAHCGGGTHSLIAGDPDLRQLDIAVDPFDRYVPGPTATLDLVEEASRYLPTLTRRLSDLDSAFDLCIYNAGMDPFEGSAIGGLSGITREILAERERLVFGWFRKRRVPVAFVLAGGYVGPDLDRERLVELHRLTIEAARETA